MSEVNEDQLRYPIGKFKIQGEITEKIIKDSIRELEEAPGRLFGAVDGLNDDQLNTPYRQGGWTVKQVVHHLPDSHLNSYIRFKLALTEKDPLVKTYEEAKWAELPDSYNTPISVSLELLKNLHLRWTILLKSMSFDDFKRTFNHPENGIVRLDRTVALYAWHSNHHIAHITSLRKRMGW